MQIDASIVIPLVTGAFLIGGAIVAFFMTKFVQIKDCKINMDELKDATDKRIDGTWLRIDAISDSLTGGRYYLEVQLVQKKEVNP